MLSIVKGYISQRGSNISSKGCQISFLSVGVSFVSLTKQKYLPILRQAPSSLLLLLGGLGLVKPKVESIFIKQ